MNSQLLGSLTATCHMFFLSKKKRLSESSGAAASVLYVNKVGYGPDPVATVASDELNSLFYEEEKMAAKRPSCG